MTNVAHSGEFYKNTSTQIIFWLSCVHLDSTDCQRCERMCARVRERVHQLHHVGGERTLPPGEEEDHQRGGHPVCHVHAGLRHVRGAAEALFAEVQRGEM